MLADIVNIKQWLSADAERAYGDRVERDAGIGASIETREPAARVLQWWQHVEPSMAGAQDEHNTVGARVERARRLSTAVLIAVGILAGLSVTATALTYTGDAPVNLLTLLAVLVALPGLLLLLSLLALLPEGSLDGLKRSVVGTNPGYWLSTWLEQRVGLAISPASRPAWLRLSRWQLVVTSQAMAVAYFVSALATLLALVALTDLAFGWSSTLNMSPETIAAWVNALALPWSSWLPGAAPDAALVAESRFFRLDSDVSASAQRLGQWWPFVGMTVAVYGLLPRLLLLGVGLWRRRASLNRLLLDDSDVTALLDRIKAPLLTRDVEAVRQGVQAGSREAVRVDAQGDAAVLVWNNAAAGDDLDALLQTLRVTAQSVTQTGSGQPVPSLDGHSPNRVIWVTKGWEPPLLEFIDAAAKLRESIGAEATIAIAPRPLDGSEIRADDQRIWSAALARAADPKLIVLGGGE